MLSLGLSGQITNYVSNPGFEEVFPGSNPPSAKYWNAIKNGSYFGSLLSANLLPFNVPLSSFTYQWPRHGYNFFIATPFCSTCTYNKRGYPKNELKETLVNGKTYCFSMFINLSNKSSYAISSIGAYFSNNSIDTINYCTIPLTYLTPQIQNSIGNYIIDTLRWVPITGTFVATGIEKYLVVGNFNNDTNSDTLFVNPSILPQRGCSYLFDDISLVDIDLPAYAGRDTSVIPGDSIFIGREPDIGIDDACMWYKLPTIITPTAPALDTVAGFWIKPVTSCTYIVRQQLWCSGVKWDTVVIHMNPVGIEKLKILTEELKLFPVPAKDELQLSIHFADLIVEFHSLSIFNNLGLLIREEETKFQNGSFKINTADLPSGVYSLQLKSNSNETVSKRFVITR